MRRRYSAGAQGPAFLVVLLDGGVLVVDVQARGDPGGDNPGPEPSRCRVGSAPPQLAVEDEADLVGAADVEVVVQHLFEEDPPGDRAVQDLGQGELGLQHRELVAIPRGPVREIGRASCRERVYDDV